MSRLHQVISRPICQLTLIDVSCFSHFVLGWNQNVDFDMILTVVVSAFSALTLLVRWLEEHLACEKLSGEVLLLLFVVVNCLYFIYMAV